jgi:hypothetical protein
MAIPERPNLNLNSSLSRTELDAKLADIDRRLELVDANENTFERHFSRERLLELQEEIQNEIDEIDVKS